MRDVIAWITYWQRQVGTWGARPAPRAQLFDRGAIRVYEALRQGAAHAAAARALGLVPTGAGWAGPAPRTPAQ